MKGSVTPLARPGSGTLPDLDALVSGLADVTSVRHATDLLQQLEVVARRIEAAKSMLIA